jgi:hypothetical protein
MTSLKLCKPGSTHCRRYFTLRQLGLLLIYTALSVGCGVDLKLPTPSPVQSTILRHTDANGVATLAVLPDSYDSAKVYPWIIYNHGFGQTIDPIITYPPQSNFVQVLASAGYVVIGSDYRNLPAGATSSAQKTSPTCRPFGSLS